MKQDTHDIVERLRLDLLEARKSRDEVAAEAFRSVLSAIDNAGAVPVLKNPEVTEVPRREVDESEIKNIIAAEIAEMRSVVGRLGRDNEQYKVDLLAKISTLDRYL